MHQQSIQHGAAPPTPPASEEPIDLNHLLRMTLGDARLQREVLDLFDQQIELLIARMHSAPPAAAATLAHTLKGSARGIGAWGVVRAAEAIEMAATSGADLADPLEAMRAAGDTARSAIRQMRQSEADAAGL